MDGHKRIAALGALTAAAATAVVAGFWVAARSLDVPFSYVSREPQSAVPGALEWYAVSLSNLSVLVSAVAAVAALVGGAGRWLADRRGDLTAFLLWGGVFLAALTVDDLFLLHEHLYSRLAPEALISPAYGVPVAILVWRFRAVLRAEGGGLFLAGGAALLGSVATSELWDGHHLVEDGAKLLGYALWATFFVRVALRGIRDVALR